MNAILKHCFIFCLIFGTEGQIAKCDYGYQINTTPASKTTNDSCYSCLLNTIQANYNEKLTRIDGHHETGHSDADVKCIINYDYNRLKTFSSIFCQKFPNLEGIWINEAELESIDEDSLTNCKNLDRLFLSGNKIRELPKNLLTANSKLTQFWINVNQLTILPENLFQNQKELEMLNMNKNQLTFVPRIIFQPLVKLEGLDLHNNQLQSIKLGWFVNLQNLKRLGLNGNHFSEVPSKCFASLSNLEILWLNRNRIKSLTSDSFDGLQNLGVLYLGNNRISDLPVGVIAPLNNLQVLDLKSNKLTTIHSDSFGVNNQLKYVLLQNNKINAIDEEFIYKTGVIGLNMTNNICSRHDAWGKHSMVGRMQNCFPNYKPRPTPSSSSCGQSVVFQGNMYGGAKITSGSFPWIAALLKPNGEFFCGGTLVSNRKVVTAAHCIIHSGYLEPLFPLNEVKVLLGFFNLDIKNETGRVNVKVHSIHIHPEWNTRTVTFDADIAVLFLEHQIDFSPQIQPICMTSSDSRIASESKGIVVGNGKSENEKIESIPKFIEMPIQKDEICMKKNSFFEFISSGRTFCAGSADGNGICSGESGSGFVVKIGAAYYLRGIVSVALASENSNCDAKTYALFTDALKFIDWINGI